MVAGTALLTVCVLVNAGTVAGCVDGLHAETHASITSVTQAS